MESPGKSSPFTTSPAKPSMSDCFAYGTQINSRYGVRREHRLNISINSAMRALPVQVARVTKHVVLEEWYQKNMTEVDLRVVYV